MWFFKIYIPLDTGTKNYTENYVEATVLSKSIEETQHIFD